MSAGDEKKTGDAKSNVAKDFESPNFDVVMAGGRVTAVSLGECL